MELGITDKSQVIKDLLGLLSRSDFYHDFAMIKVKTLVKQLKSSIPINAPSYYTSKINEFIEKNKDKSIYDIFENTNLLTPSDKKEIIKTDKVIQEILNLDIKKIKDELKENEENYGLLKEAKEDTIKPPTNIKIDINYQNKIRRNYEYSCYPTKVRGEYFNLPFVFRKLTNKNNFILLIDSTLFSLKKMRRRDIVRTLVGDRYDDTQTYTFYIIKNN